MKHNIEVFKIWAPDPTLHVWSKWAKPALFMNVKYVASSRPLQIEPAEWMSAVDYGTAIIVDMPSVSSIEKSLALAKLGYRPVPLYNGVQGVKRTSMIVDVYDLANGLYAGAEELLDMPIPVDAPPVFMLDANRMKGIGKQPGKFDNRWSIFPQDMPSANFMHKKGIHSVIVRTETLQNDLTHILMRYQEKGIRIYVVNNNNVITEKPVVKPSLFKSVLYRYSVVFGLKRNAAGGFGGQIPEATQSSGGRSYGIG